MRLKSDTHDACETTKIKTAGTPVSPEVRSPLTTWRHCRWNDEEGGQRCSLSLGFLPSASLLGAPSFPPRPPSLGLSAPGSVCTPLPLLPCPMLWGCPAEGIRVVSSVGLESAVWMFVQLLSRIRLFVTPWTAAHQAPLSLSISWTLLKLVSVELVMPSNRLILCRPLLLLPSIIFVSP